MDKQGEAISAKIWYIRQEAVIFFCLPHYHILGEVEEIKKWIFFFFVVVVSDMGLSLCSAFYHRESWKFKI